jgi:hypothetical protein
MYATEEGGRARGHKNLASGLIFSTVLLTELNDSSTLLGELLDAVDVGLEKGLPECRPQVEGVFEKVKDAVRCRSQEYAGLAAVAGGVPFSPQVPELLFSEQFYEGAVLSPARASGAGAAAGGAGVSLSPGVVRSVAGVGASTPTRAAHPTGVALGPRSWSVDVVRHWAVLVAGVPETEVPGLWLEGAQLVDLSAQELGEELDGVLSSDSVTRVNVAVADGCWFISKAVSVPLMFVRTPQWPIVSMSA